LNEKHFPRHFSAQNGVFPGTVSFYAWPASLFLRGAENYASVEQNRHFQLHNFIVYNFTILLRTTTHFAAVKTELLFIGVAQPYRSSGTVTILHAFH